jgi:hypothetical protein
MQHSANVVTNVSEEALASVFRVAQQYIAGNKNLYFH